MPRHKKFEKWGHRYDRRRNKVKEPGELVISDEYREFVKGILKDARRRQLIESYRNLSAE